MKAISHKVALITGGNRGLGLQTARELGRMGMVRKAEENKNARAWLRRETSGGFEK